MTTKIGHQDAGSQEALTRPSADEATTVSETAAYGAWLMDVVPIGTLGFGVVRLMGSTPPPGGETEARDASSEDDDPGPGHG